MDGNLVFGKSARALLRSAERAVPEDEHAVRVRRDRLLHALEGAAADVPGRDVHHDPPAAAHGPRVCRAQRLPAE